MAITESYTPQRPGQKNGAGAIDALHIEEYTGIVEKTIARLSVVSPMVPLRTVRGTSMITNYAVGESTLQKVVPGVVLDGTLNDFSRRVLHVEVHIAARNIIPNIEVFQTEYDARKEIGEEHGKKLAKFKDQALSIQAIKAGLSTDSSYNTTPGDGKPKGHFGGSQQTLAAAGDAQDPAKLYAAIAGLLTKMELKDVDPRNENTMILVKPDKFYTLMQADQLVNVNYITAAGNDVKTWVLKTYGVPVISSNNFAGGENITSHFLDTVNNGNAFSGDYTKVVACAFSPRALLAGYTLPLSTDVFYDKLSKSWFVDADEAFSATTNRNEFSGVILSP